MARTSVILLLAVLLLVSPCHAVHKAARLKATTKGERRKGTRKQGWRRRAQDYQQAKKATFVANPSSLAGKGGNGKGNQITYTSEDGNGRTTFMIKCDEETYVARKFSESGNEKAPLKAGDLARKAGKGKGKGGVGASGTAEARDVYGSEFSDICDEYAASGAGNADADGDADGNMNGMTGGGWQSGNGGSADSGGGFGDGNGVVVTPGSGGDGYPEYDTETGQVENANGMELGLHACETIGVGGGPTTDSSEKVEVTLDVVHQIEANANDGGSDAILSLMRADLQENVAPVIADCITDTGAISASGSDLGVIEGSSGNGGFGSSGSGSYVGYDENSTLITNAHFGALGGTELGCDQYDNYFQPTDTEYKCMLTSIPVDLYYDGTDTSDFEERVQTAIDRHKWNVPGLMMTSTVHTDSGGSITAIEGNEAQEDDRIGAGGFVMIAASALVLLLLALMLVRRRHKDEMIKHVSLEDDDDTYLRDVEGESTHSEAEASNRIASLVGDDTDSVRTGWTGASTHFRNVGSLDAMFSQDRPSHQDVHACSSATCEVCERNRQSGVQFIKLSTGRPTDGASPPSQPPLPPASPREYSSNDTVSL